MCFKPSKSAIIEAPQNAPKDSSLGALNGSKAKLGAINNVVVAKDVRDIKANDF